MSQRTLKQNNSGHKWFRELASKLNESGYEEPVVIGTIDVPWTEDSVKKVLFGKVIRAMFGKNHTSELTTKEMKEAATVVSRAISEQGVEVPPWPSEEEQAIEALLKE